MLAAFRQDVEEASAEELTAVPCAGITLTYDLPVSDMGGKIIRSKGETELYSASYYIYPTFTRTIAILKQKGCPVSVKDADIKCVNVVYAGTDSEEDWQNSEVMEITDHKEIEELKQGMVLDILCPGWVETEEGVSLDVYKEDDKNGENESYVLLKDQVPQFIQEGKEKFQEGLDTVIVYETEETE